MAMIKKYQKGNKVEYPILSKVLLNRNKDLDFVKRINDSSKSISNEDGSISTHLMRAEIDDKGNWYMFPQIVNQQGTLKDLGEGSFDYALKSGENISVPNKDLAIWLASNNYKNMNKFQQGGPIDFTQLLGGDWQSLFSSFLNPQGAQPTGYGVEGENYDNQDDFLRAYHENEIDEEFEDKWFFPKARANRQKKKLNKSIESGEIYDDPNTQNITNQGRMEGIGNYFQSPDFLAGLSDLGNQYKDYQQNLKSEKFNMPVDHSGYKVGQDRGFQAGGYVGPAQSFILDTTKIASDDLTKFSTAIKEHESFSDYTRKQGSGGPGRGAYQFDTPSLKTAAKKAKRIYKKLDIDYPEEFDDIIKGDIKDATQLHPELQDELFFSSLTKVKPVKDKNGRIKRYDIVPFSNLDKYDYRTSDGMADAWQRFHNRGKTDRRGEFITSLSRLGDYQRGGDVRVSTQGYKQGSPDSNEDSLIIPGGNITMDGVDQSLLLLPSNGQAVLAGPNSGDYNFPGADYVKEIPMFQQGGEVQPVPIQTEKGEMLSFEDGTLTPVKAKKRHKSMGADEATDIVPEGTYVFSRDKSMILNKKDADEISLGYGPIKYEEGKNSEAPREVFFGEIFNKKTQTPASVGKAIKRLYPVTERENDAFAEQAKQENKVSRFPYIEALKQMSELKKQSQYTVQDRIQLMGYETGGSVAKNMSEYGSEIVQVEGDPWEYTKSGDDYYTRKKGSNSWIKSSGKAKKAIQNKVYKDYAKDVKATGSSEKYGELQEMPQAVEQFSVAPVEIVANKKPKVGEIPVQEFEVTPTPRDSEARILDVPIDEPLPEAYDRWGRRIGVEDQPKKEYVPEFDEHGILTNPVDTGYRDYKNRNIQLSNEANMAFQRMVEDGMPVNSKDFHSTYRDKSENERVGGAEHSKHTRGNAIDVHGSTGEWIRKHGHKYGWYAHDYKGTHGGHYEYRGKKKRRRKKNKKHNHKTGGMVSLYQMGGSVAPKLSLGTMYKPMYPQSTQTFGDPALKRDNNFLSSGVGQSPSLQMRQPSFKQGGTVPKYFVEGLVAALSGIDPTSMAKNVSDIAATWTSMRRMKKNQKQTVEDLDQFRADQTGRNQMGMQLGAASALAQYALQDPSYTYADFNPEEALTKNKYKSMRDRMISQEKALLEKQQAPINTMYRSMSMANPNMAANVAGSMYGQYLDQSGMTGLQMMDKQNVLDQGEYGALKEIMRARATDQQGGRMYEKSATNLLNQGLAKGVAGAGQNYLTQESQNALTNVSGKMGARNQLASGMNQLGYLQAQNIGQLAGTGMNLGNLYNQYQSQQNQRQMLNSQMASYQAAIGRQQMMQDFTSGPNIGYMNQTLPALPPVQQQGIYTGGMGVDLPQ